MDKRKFPTEEEMKKLEKEREILSKNASYRLLLGRVGTVAAKEFTPSAVEGVNDLAGFLRTHGGYHQQERMIRDKRKSLDRALLYSYQAGLVKKQYPEQMELMEGVREAPPIRALLNPNKLKADYDEKIISVGFEHGFKPGDIFEWIGTGTHWLIYLQELTELAYFRGDCRKCQYEISWVDEDGNVQSTYCSVRGPVETKINYIQKHRISVDTPNYSLNILMPRNKATLEYFRRYSKFYLKGISEGDVNICWRVEATDSISTPGILEVVAVEYYANETEDDMEKGLVGGLKIEPIDPNEGKIVNIEGDSFIKPKKTYQYSFSGQDAVYTWKIDKKYPVKIISQDNSSITLKWDVSYSGQFELQYGNYTKTIVVESLF